MNNRLKLEYTKHESDNNTALFFETFGIAEALVVSGSDGFTLAFT